MEAKPFSIGFRIEHPQSLIDKARFGPRRQPAARCRRLQAGAPLPQRALGVQLLHVPRRHGGRRHFRANRVVTNGMSQYSRNERNANAGIVVGITPLDYPGGPLAGIELQRDLEARAFALGGGSYEAPAQLVGDFLAGRPSTSLGGDSLRTSPAFA
jgi:uncharacterized FAD-dependent dehydrogenase